MRESSQPSRGNGLREPSWLMVDKITTIPKANLGTPLGRLSVAHLGELNRALVVFLGIADRPAVRA
jgi:mRNA interferase MazF